MTGFYRYFLILVLVCAVVCGCSSRGGASLDCLEKFVDSTEKRASSYSAEDWELNEEQYEKLKEKLENEYSSMTQDEKERALKAIGRYNGLLVKYAIKQGADVLDEITKALPSLLDGFAGAFEDFDIESIIGGVGAEGEAVDTVSDDEVEFSSDVY